MVVEEKPVAPPTPTVPPPPPPVPSNEQRIGFVTHYYSHLGVAVVQIDQGEFRVGDRIHIKGHTSDFVQAVESLEVEHQTVEQAGAGQIFGLKVTEHVREHDQIYKIL